MSYSKLHSSLVNSSLWTEPDAVRLLFITLLAMCDRDGVVYGSRLGLSRIAHISVDEIEEAWETLLDADPESSDRMRAPENEGRRIEEVSGGFRLLNFEYYRGLRNDDERREQNREAQARFKAKVSQSKPRKSKVIHDKPQKAHAEAESDTEAEKTPPPIAPPASPGERAPKISAESIYSAYPKKTGKQEALKHIASAMKTTSPQTLLEKTMAYAAVVATWPETDKVFVPDPERWYKKGRWEDDPATWIRQHKNGAVPGDEDLF